MCLLPVGLDLPSQLFFQVSFYQEKEPQFLVSFLFVVASNLEMNSQLFLSTFVNFAQIERTYLKWKIYG